MSRFAMITEDPSYLYDEDGFCVDEDAVDEVPEPSLNELLQVKLGIDPYSPFVTINS